MSPRPEPHSDRCPECGRQTPLSVHGIFKRHRPEADTWIGPYCPGSGTEAQR